PRERPFWQAIPTIHAGCLPATNNSKGTLVKSRSIRLGGITLVTAALAAVVCGSSVSPAYATNINIGGTECQAGYSSESQDDVDHYVDGVVSLGAVASLPYIVCSLPRSPLATGATSGGFYVDGDNWFGATTTCTVYSYDYTGLFLGSSSASSSAANYDM